MNLKQQNRRTALRLGVAAVCMVGFGYLMVPLYDVFCEITGLGGKTAVMSTADADRVRPDADRWVTLYLDTTTNSELPWDFQPTVRKLRVQPGKIHVVGYRIENRADHTLVGRAIPSMAPARASKYFNKIECFCFQEQALAAGEQMELELRFVIDPQLPDDLEVLTMSYTFLLVPKEEGVSNEG